MNQIRYETDIDTVDFTKPTIFMAGCTVRGNQPYLTSWRFEAVELFKKKGFDGNLIIPEFVSKTESDKHRPDRPIWEFKGLQRCGVIMFWINRSRELIGLTSNHEHGYWMGRDRSKMVYGRPDDAYRMAYLDIMWVQDANRLNIVAEPIYRTLETTVEAALVKLNWTK